MPKTAFVPGGCGFIGSYLVQRLLNSGWNVRVLDDLSTGRVANLLRRRRLTVIAGSVLDASGVSEAAQGADIVFHLAGVEGPGLTAALPELAWRVATEGTENVLAATTGVPTVLFSSSAVYGPGDSAPRREEDMRSAEQAVRLAAGPRGAVDGKVAMEQMGLRASRSRPLLIVRPFGVVGPGQVGTYGKVLPTFVGRARAGLPLQVFGGREQRRAFSHVGTFVEALIGVVAQRRAWQGYPILNIGAETAWSVDELAHLVRLHVGSDVPIVRQDAAGRSAGHSLRPDTSRLQGLVGGLEWPSLPDIVEEVVDDARRRGLDSLMEERATAWELGVAPSSQVLTAC